MRITVRNLFDHVKNHYDGDMRKAWHWMTSHCNGVNGTPLELIRERKAQKVIDYLAKHLPEHRI